jgi:hypothetical protein
MKQFEYLKVDITKHGKDKFGFSPEERLENLGREGWEAVGGYGINNSIFLFKREIEENGAVEQSQSRQYEHGYDPSY